MELNITHIFQTRKQFTFISDKELNNTHIFQKTIHTYFRQGSYTSGLSPRFAGQTWQGLWSCLAPVSRRTVPHVTRACTLWRGRAASSARTTCSLTGPRVASLAPPLPPQTLTWSTAGGTRCQPTCPPTVSRLLVVFNSKWYSHSIVG